MGDYYLGEIRLFSFNVLPRGWLRCDGSQLQVGQNQALFSLIGNQYGGDGRTTFNLPDLRGRVPVCAGRNVDGTPLAVGKNGGTEKVALTLAQMPVHNHIAYCVTTDANQVLFTDNLPGTVVRGNAQASAGNPPPMYGAYPSGTDAVTLLPAAMSNYGGNGAHENRQPYTVMNYCICNAGIYPTRD